MPLKMTHTPGEWDGTFGELVRTLATSLLADGEPQAVRVNGEARLIMLSGIDGWDLHFSDGTIADSQEIDEIEVP